MRRKKRTIISDNQNSLLDTLTNVVGVLVIMLAIAQLSVGAAVRKIKNYIEPVGILEIATFTESKSNLQKELIIEQAKWESIKNNSPLYKSEIKNLRVKSSRVSTEIFNLKKRYARIQSLQGSIEKSKEEIKALTENNNKLNSQVSELEKILSKIPKPEENAEPYQLPLPSPKIRPDRTQQFDVYCYKGKIHFIRADINDLRNNIVKIMRSRLNYIRPDQALNCSESVEYFKNNVIYKRNYQVKMAILNGELQAVLTPQPGSIIGESLEQILARSSDYQSRLSKLNTTFDFLHFYVDPESYELYIQARDIARKMSINAGWTPINSQGELYFKLDSKNPLTCIDQKKEVMPKAPSKIQIRGANTNFKGLNLSPEFLYNDLID
jgi:cell division protein FtsB